ncbi:hypothetical protein, partial [Caldimonas thermodepolymerans]|uniref:hypothetical protein n=1 Tax=Caldimonas thermodepolymerans TaxID=215580 RepID=UPI001A9D3BAA
MPRQIHTVVKQAEHLDDSPRGNPEHDEVTALSALGSSSFRVEPNSHNDSWSSSPVGMCAGRWPACA